MSDTTETGPDAASDDPSEEATTTGADSGPPPDPRTPDEVIARLRSFCRLLPEAVELDLLGSPVFRVATVTFASYELEGDQPVITVKLGREDQKMLIRMPGFEASPDTGDHGWTRIVVDDSTDWEHVDEIVVRAYRAVAPSHLLSTLEFLLRAADNAEDPETVEAVVADLEEKQNQSNKRFTMFGFQEVEPTREEDVTTRQGIFVFDVADHSYDQVIEALHQWMKDHPHVMEHRLFQSDG